MFDGSGFRGLERAVRDLGGARVVRVIHPPGQIIGEHRHDRPFLMLPTLGSFVERSGSGEICIDGYSAVLHPAGTCHANHIGCSGLEAVSIEFDPDWVSVAGLPDRSRFWTRGPVASAARSLAALVSDRSASDEGAREATLAFLRTALASPVAPAPDWLDDVQALLNAAQPMAAAQIARQVGIHPAWLMRLYRSATGEGVREKLGRKQVERAVGLLRGTDLPLAEIAAAAGYCDQSHMNRAFKKLAQRTPLAVRNERDALGLFLQPDPPD